MLFLLVCLASLEAASPPAPPVDGAVSSSADAPADAPVDASIDAPVAPSIAEAPADAVASPAVVEVAPAVVEPAAPPAVQPRKIVRIAVQGLDAEGLSARGGRLFTASLVGELRKLKDVSVVGMDEVDALLSLEASAQMVGCDDVSCLGDLADALGADILVTARLAAVDDSEMVSFRRFEMANAAIRGVDRRFERGNGEAFLASIGPAVAELFPDTPLRDGAVRGVEKEAALRLNPPPIPAWAFYASGALAGAALATGAVAGSISAALKDSAQQRVNESSKLVISGAELERDLANARSSALVANIAFVSTGALIVATGVLGLFTDFEGYADDTL